MTETNNDRPPMPHRLLAGRVALTTLVVLGILALVTVVWVGRVVVALLFFAVVIASAIRPSIEAMRRRRGAGDRNLEWVSVWECRPNGAVILRAWVDAARATRRGLTRKEPVFERHG
jgi:hypothetical protein